MTACLWRTTWGKEVTRVSVPVTKASSTPRSGPSEKAPPVPCGGHGHGNQLRLLMTHVGHRVEAMFHRVEMMRHSVGNDEPKIQRAHKIRCSDRCRAEDFRVVPTSDESKCSSVRVLSWTYSITSSTRARSAGEMVRPSAFAVFRLITS
jgi:hypothetical protein